MAAAAIVNLISTGSAGLGISEASTVKGALLLQLCLSSWICLVSQEWKLGRGSSCNTLSSPSPSGSHTCCSFPELNGGCHCTGGRYKLKLQVSTEEALEGDTLWVAL